MIRQSLIAALLLFGLPGCGSTPVLVLDDETGNPIAGARVTPMTENLLGAPTDRRGVTTDASGRATVPYSERKLWALHAKHPDFLEFQPGDKPRRDGDLHLLYMRRPPRVIVVVPADFVGPVLISGLVGGSDPRRAVYRFPLADDPLEPIDVSPVDWKLFQLEAVEAERGGVAVTRAGRSPDPAAVHVWKLRYLWGVFYEDHYIQMLFVGTAGQFKVFDRALHEILRRQGYPHNKLNRAALVNLRAVIGEPPRSEQASECAGCAPLGAE